MSFGMIMLNQNIEKKSKTRLHGYRQVDSPLKTGRIYLYISKDIKARIEIMN